MLTYEDRAFALDRGDAIIRGTLRESAPTMVLLHAGRENRRVWDQVIDELQTRLPMRCLTIDQRGHGESGGTRDRFAPVVADLAALLRHVPGPTVLVGCSLGGLAALGAVAGPAVARSVMGVVLVDVVADLQPGPVWAFLEGAGLLPEAEPIAREILGAGAELHRALASFPGEVALVRAESSAMTDADVQRFAEARPDAPVIDIAGAGHLVAHDQPVALATSLASVTAAWLAAR